MDNESQQPKKAWEVSGVFVPAGLLIGMGIGWMFGSLVPGLFIGLGAGLLSMAIIRLVTGR